MIKLWSEPEDSSITLMNREVVENDLMLWKSDKIEELLQQPTSQGER